MREILFRGKTVRWEWVTGLLAHVGNAWYISNKAGVATAYEVIPNTVEQYTGLKDKNGKKIFEGDICKVGNLIYKVVFEYSCWWFKILSNKVYCCPAFNSHCGEHCEIIGNIHDNPELLEVSVYGTES